MIEVQNFKMDWTFQYHVRTKCYNDKISPEIDKSHQNYELGHNIIIIISPKYQEYVLGPNVIINFRPEINNLCLEGILKWLL